MLDHHGYGSGNGNGDDCDQRRAPRVAAWDDGSREVITRAFREAHRAGDLLLDTDTPWRACASPT
ncbi:hypothetical protein ACIQU6_19490 [Streptomyces sp. NPDC090442]|uniref:hypothetical protein n=1 Tax=Streptomyces sp. NPDC090442 TaxID=3365962 RepID=UPI003815E5EA